MWFLTKSSQVLNYKFTYTFCMESFIKQSEYIWFAALMLKKNYNFSCHEHVFSTRAILVYNVKSFWNYGKKTHLKEAVLLYLQHIEHFKVNYLTKEYKKRPCRYERKQENPIINQLVHSLIMWHISLYIYLYCSIAFIDVQIYFHTWNVTVNEAHTHKNYGIEKFTYLFFWFKRQPIHNPPHR